MSQFPPPGPPGPPPGHRRSPAGGLGSPGSGVPPPAYGAPPPWGPPVHQPGVVPLRPLTLGDMFGGLDADHPAQPGGHGRDGRPGDAGLHAGPRRGDAGPRLRRPPALAGPEQRQGSDPTAGIGLNAATPCQPGQRRLQRAGRHRRDRPGDAGRRAGRDRPATHRGRRPGGRAADGCWPLLGLSLLAGLISTLVVGLPIGASGSRIGLLAGNDVAGHPPRRPRRTPRPGRAASSSTSASSCWPRPTSCIEEQRRARPRCAGRASSRGASSGGCSASRCWPR